MYATEKQNGNSNIGVDVVIEEEEEDDDDDSIMVKSSCLIKLDGTKRKATEESVVALLEPIQIKK